jgi:hypothetical protein
MKHQRAAALFLIFSFSWAALAKKSICKLVFQSLQPIQYTPNRHYMEKQARDSWQRAA